MSLIKLSSDRFEQFTLITNPRQEYASSSLGVTGSIDFRARKSTIIKDEIELGVSLLTPASDVTIEADRFALADAVLSSIAEGGGDSSASAEFYMTRINETPESAINSKVLGVERFTPTTGGFEQNLLKKSAVINTLMPHYRSRYPEAHYAYTNYHTLNFFTASSVPSNTAIVYPNSSSSGQLYSPTGSFTVDLYINPRYTTLTENDAFHAGTILHLSSTLALSLVTGSQRNKLGTPESFRLLLQLSHSAGTNPADVDLTIANNARTFPNDLIFISDDNVLTRNTWNHVAIRWGTSTTNAGSGSFVINGTTEGTFNVPSSSIHEPLGCESLLVGNFYEDSPSPNLARYFNATAAANEGLVQLSAATSDPTAPLTNPLNAEIHDLKLFGAYRSLPQILTSSMNGPSDLTDLLFYVPPFFVRESPTRINPISPFYTRTSTTHDPFSVEYSFRVGGHLINVENFSREFVQGTHPRLFNLTASVSVGSLDGDLLANDYLFATGSTRKRNLTVLPCDNGLFVPNFDLLQSGTLEAIPASGSNIEKFVSDLGAYNNRLITLRNQVPTRETERRVALTDEAFASSMLIEPNTFWDPYWSSPWQIYGQTRDNTSNQVVFFDVTNLMFGRRIDPETVIIADKNITGSNSRVSITLRDDGRGNLYRADADTAHATWASVGNVFYDEGIVLVKSPNLPLFGKDQYELSFQGEQHIHIMRINVPCPAGQVNSSSNPVYTPVSATLNANDSDPAFVYITSLAYHDENLNVVMRTNLAQPIVKRTTDKFLFRPRIDW